MNEPIDEAVARLQRVFDERRGSDEVFDRMIDSRDRVIERYQRVFTPDHLARLTAEEFRAFLIFENNTHWSGLHRQGPRICQDMQKLREMLSTLLDEELPIGRRLERATENISGMGKAIATAILIVHRPESYGVWNSTSENGLVEVGLYPSFDRGTSFGAKYEDINAVLKRLADALGVDLWTLDVIWWRLLDEEEPETAIEVTSDELAPKFGLERHLHEFLRDNWDSTRLAKDGWRIVSEGGDDTAGYEYPCPIGRIDLLARHHDDGRWLVIELERAQTSDETVGQVLRYTGWVRAHLCSDEEDVEGLIIAHKPDERLHYALREVPHVSFQRYEVDFQLLE